MADGGISQSHPHDVVLSEVERSRIARYLDAILAVETRRGYGADRLTEYLAQQGVSEEARDAAIGGCGVPHGVAQALRELCRDGVTFVEEFSDELGDDFGRVLDGARSAPALIAAREALDDIARSKKAGELDDDWPFRISAGGVARLVKWEDKKTGETQTAWKPVCSFLHLKALTRTNDGTDWGLHLQIVDRDGSLKDWVMPRSMLSAEGAPYRERLLSLGVEIEPGAKGFLHEYLSKIGTDRRARSVKRFGWHDQSYIAAGQVFGSKGAEPYVLQSSGDLDHGFRTRGTLAAWQQRVARYAVGNSRLALALSTAFAAPLIYLINGESGGFHYRGNSSGGKTTALRAAGSVCGGGGVSGFVRTWRTTSNGLEGVAAVHCDALLCLDELHQVEGHEAGQIAYMLANGQGKGRARQSGEARAAAEWRLLFLSSGELSLADKIAEDGRGKRIAAGQEVRVIDIPADAGAGLGMWENLHGFVDGGAFANCLKSATSEQYGTALPAFLRELVKHELVRIGDRLSVAVREFGAANVPAGADGQVTRVAARFGLVAAAGELAIEFGILPWPKGEAVQAAARCFTDWLDARGGIGASEIRRHVTAVQTFIEKHGTSRFEAYGALAPKDRHQEPIDQRIINRAGFRRRASKGDGTEWCIFPETWNGEVCAGLDPTTVAETLAARGMLLVDGKGKRQVGCNLPGLGTTRCYVVTSAIFGEGGMPATGHCT